MSSYYRRVLHPKTKMQIFLCKLIGKEVHIFVTGNEVFHLPITNEMVYIHKIWRREST